MKILAFITLLASTIPAFAESGVSYTDYQTYRREQHVEDLWFKCQSFTLQQHLRGKSYHDIRLLITPAVNGQRHVIATFNGKNVSTEVGQASTFTSLKKLAHFDITEDRLAVEFSTDNSTAYQLLRLDVDRLRNEIDEAAAYQNITGGLRAVVPSKRNIFGGVKWATQEMGVECQAINQASLEDDAYHLSRDDAWRETECDKAPTSATQAAACLPVQAFIHFRQLVTGREQHPRSRIMMRQGPDLKFHVYLKIYAD